MLSGLSICFLSPVVSLHRAVQHRPSRQVGLLCRLTSCIRTLQSDILWMRWVQVCIWIHLVGFASQALPLLGCLPRGRSIGLITFQAHCFHRACIQCWLQVRALAALLQPMASFRRSVTGLSCNRWRSTCLLWRDRAPRSCRRCR